MSLAVLWLLRRDISVNSDALLFGGISGAVYAGVYWRLLQRRIARANRRYERNKIFVQFISVFEILMAVAGSGIYVLMAVAAVLILVIIFNVLTDYRWAVFGGSFGVVGTIALTVLILTYERKHGPLYYQYDSSGWLGGEGMLYRVGVVEETLAPRGLVNLDGELWSAVSKDGEAIEKGEKVEVISRKGLVLHVDRISVVPASTENRKPD